MTTIVYRNGVLAGDRRAYSGEKTPIGSKRKVHRLEDGTLFGCSSSNVGADALIKRWIAKGCPPPEGGEPIPDHFQVLIVRPNGEVFYAKNNLDLSGPLEAPFFAIGSGEAFALGALEMGASAVQAVEIACRLDPWTGNGVDQVGLSS